MCAITVDKRYCFATKAMRKRHAWAERLRRHGFVAAQWAQPKRPHNPTVSMQTSRCPPRQKTSEPPTGMSELGPEAAIRSLGLSIIDLASPEQTESNCTDDALG